MRSKKRSGANKLLPDPLVFFLDESIGQNVVASALRAAGYSVVVHNEIFTPGIPDEVWLSAVGHRGWLGLTKDSSIRYRSHEKRAVESTAARLFILSAGNLTSVEMANAFVAAAPRMIRLARRQPAPFFARVSASGLVTQLK